MRRDRGAPFGLIDRSAVGTRADARRMTNRVLSGLLDLAQRASPLSPDGRVDRRSGGFAWSTRLSYLTVCRIDMARIGTMPQDRQVPVEYRLRSDPCTTCGAAVVMTRLAQSERRGRRREVGHARGWSLAHAANQTTDIGVDDECPFLPLAAAGSDGTSNR